jgi:hypothetical protein
MKIENESPINKVFEIPLFISLKSKYVVQLAKTIAEGQQISPPSQVKGNRYQINCSVKSDRTKNKVSMICRLVVVI